MRGRGIRFCFVTLDEGLMRYATDERKPSKISKVTKLSQALYDRIYLLTDKTIRRGETVFRSIKEVAYDLELWLEEMKG